MQAPIIRRNPRAAFALIDPLIGLLAVATVMVGVLNFWRLAEYKCDRARIDARDPNSAGKQRLCGLHIL